MNIALGILVIFEVYFAMTAGPVCCSNAMGTCGDDVALLHCSNASVTADLNIATAT